MALKFLAWANGSSRGTSETALTRSKRARAVNRGHSFLPIEFAGPNWKLQSYSRRASSFQDEDGNGWTLSELIWRVQLGRQGALDDGSSTPGWGRFSFRSGRSVTTKVRAQLSSTHMRSVSR